MGKHLLKQIFPSTIIPFFQYSIVPILKDAGFFEFSVNLFKDLGNLTNGRISFTAFEKMGHHILLVPCRLFEVLQELDNLTIVPFPFDFPKASNLLFGGFLPVFVELIKARYCPEPEDAKQQQ